MRAQRTAATGAILEMIGKVFLNSRSSFNDVARPTTNAIAFTMNGDRSL